MAIQMTWFKHSVNTKQDIIEMIRTFKRVQPTYSSFDTETNGLHITQAKPFMIVVGFINPTTKEGHTYVVDFRETPKLKHSFMYTIEKLFKKQKRVVAWNAKFDLHMLHNIGYEAMFENNITDAMVYTRLAHDALSKSEGGVPDSLKDYAKQYIDPNAKHHERNIKSWQAKMKKERTKKLKTMLSQIPLPDKYKITGNEKTWTMQIIENLTKDKVLSVEDLDDNIASIIKEWQETTPDPKDYSNIDREILEPYAHLDVIYTLESYMRARAVALKRGQKSTILLEERLIMPLYRMERVGFAFNYEYAVESKERVKNYILRKRKRLKEIADEDISIGQHAEIKRILYQKFAISVPSTNEKTLKSLNTENALAKEFADTIVELRTLEKWYSTYIIRYLKENTNGRVYTSIKQTGAASGRVSSDFQQFPNKPITDTQGNTLFHPRRMMKTTGNGYNKLLYIDYSQIELRIQALYTLLIEEGDRNLCRAYMPYHCFRKTEHGAEAFDPNKEEHLNSWKSGEWYLTETPEKKWEPIDLHSLTTLSAFDNLTEDDEAFPTYRKKGKMANFACNYGASANTLAQTFDPDTANKLYNAFVNSFPGVVAYRKTVNDLIQRQGYVENLYGRRYYGISGHKASNYLIQGSAADFLKQKIIEVDELLKNYKTRFQMNIHDELSFELHEDDPNDLPFKIKRIMEKLPGTKVPIVADLEISDTTWDEKRNYE